MNKLLILICLVVLNISASAEKKTPTEKAKGKTDEMQQNLQLSPEQTKKIYGINLKAYTSIAEYDAKNPSKKLKKKQKEIVQNLRDGQYKKTLTTAQYKKYKDIKKKEKEEEKKLKEQKPATKK
jgi:DNA gyrase/topoisomerase IV subunit A